MLHSKTCKKTGQVDKIVAILGSGVVAAVQLHWQLH